MKKNLINFLISDHYEILIQHETWYSKFSIKILVKSTSHIKNCIIDCSKTYQNLKKFNYY
jgi:hypothetical protein